MNGLKRYAQRFHGRTVQQALLRTRQRLKEAGISSSDAKALLASAIQPKLQSSNDIFLWSDHQLRDKEADCLIGMLERRCSGEPLAYVVGFKEFWSLEFEVTQDTLIPRSDSEVLIETLTALYPADSRLRILDIGTGSGCLLLAALSEYKHARGVGIDISAGALSVSRRNADRLGLATRSSFIEVDMELLPFMDTETQASQQSELYQQFDVILCNPPYIPVSELPLIAPDVLRFEPHGALFAGGPNVLQGLATDSTASIKASDDDVNEIRFYDALCRALKNLLDPRSSFRPSVLLEIGSERQAREVARLFSDSQVFLDSFLFDGNDRYRGILLRGSSSRVCEE